MYFKTLGAAKKYSESELRIVSHNEGFETCYDGSDHEEVYHFCSL